MIRWEIMRTKLVEAFDEVGRALRACKSEEDLLLVLDLVETYPALARTDLKSPSDSSRRLEAMRAAVHAMRGALDPVGPLNKKTP